MNNKMCVLWKRWVNTVRLHIMPLYLSACVSCHMTAYVH